MDRDRDDQAAYRTGAVLHGVCEEVVPSLQLGVVHAWTEVTHFEGRGDGLRLLRSLGLR